MITKDLLQQPNETNFEYIKRIVFGKLVDKTITLDYEDLSELVFGDNNCFNSSEVRKRFYGIKRLIDLIELDGINSINEDDLLEKLELKKIELKKERVKLSTLRNSLNKTIREDARKELLWEEVLSAVPMAKQTEFKPLIQQDNNKSYLLNFADTHYDYFFVSENNQYSIEELEIRFNKLLGEVIKLIEKEGISELTVLNNGDSISGLIHMSQMQTMQVGLVQSAIGFSRFMGDWLNELSKYVKVIYRQVPTSNHSQIRIFDTKRNIGGEDLELMIINYIHDYLKNNNRVEVMVETDKEYITFNLQGFEIISYHGHQFKKTDNILEKINTIHRKFYDTIIIGHFHTSVEKTLFEGVDNNIELLISPSIVGSDPYSDSLLLGSKSSAKLHIYEKGKGRVQTNTFILN